MAEPTEEHVRAIAGAFERSIALLGKALRKDVGPARPTLKPERAASASSAEHSSQPASAPQSGSSALERLRAAARQSSAVDTQPAESEPAHRAQPAAQMSALERLRAAARQSSAVDAQPAESMSALERLRAAARQSPADDSAHRAKTSAQETSAMRREPAKPVGQAETATQAAGAKREAVQPAQDLSKQAEEAPRKTGETAALSAIQRLRQRAQTLPPHRPAHREEERQGAPLVKGGPLVPRGYPSKDLWPDDHRPPGSYFSLDDWERAARGNAAEGSPAEYGVVEVLTARGSVLMRVPRAHTVRRFERVGKQVVTREEVRCTAGIDPEKDAIKLFFSRVFDRCMIVLPDARPRFPGAVEPHRHRHDKYEFLVIRPRAHYLSADSEESFFCNSRWVSENLEPQPQATGPAPG